MIQQKDAAGPALGCCSASCFWNRGWGRTARAKPSGAKRTEADGTGIRANPKAARFRDKKLHDAWARTVGVGAHCSLPMVSY